MKYDSQVLKKRRYFKLNTVTKLITFMNSTQIFVQVFIELWVHVINPYIKSLHVYIWLDNASYFAAVLCVYVQNESSIILLCCHCNQTLKFLKLGKRKMVAN